MSNIPCDVESHNLVVLHSVDSYKEIVLDITESLKTAISYLSHSVIDSVNSSVYLPHSVDSYKENVLDITESLFLNRIISINKDILNSYKISLNQVIQRQEYNALCERVSNMLKMATYQICEIESVDFEQRKTLENFFEEIHFSKEIALGRVEKDKLDSDKKVLYSLCAIEHILGAVLDEEFFELTGGYKMPKDFIEFGRNLIGIS